MDPGHPYADLHISPDEVDSLFPGARRAGYSHTSDPTPEYNCIAWAAGDEQNWWWPASDAPFGAYWPPELPLEETLDNFVHAFSLLGYLGCAGTEVEVGFEKVAIYADEQGKPLHAARQLEHGAWTSKLGRGDDIEHATLEALEGAEYGRVTRLLKRPRTDQPAPATVVIRP